MFTIGYYIFLQDHQHVTKFNNVISTATYINSGIVQGSGLGPALYIIAACDLQPIGVEMSFFKYADDMFVITLYDDNTKSINEEVNNIVKWALKNNLKINKDKTKSIIFSNG